MVYKDGCSVRLHGVIRSGRPALDLQTTMRHTFAFPLAVLAITLLACAQDAVPIFKTQAMSAFVWGEDNIRGAVSSSVRDPVTNNEIRKLIHGDIEVSSRAGFERVRPGEAGELLSFTTTIVNNTESELYVRQGGASVDGRLISPLPVVRTKKGVSKKERDQVRELASMNCFTNGFLPSGAFLPQSVTSKPLAVNPKAALTVSFVTKDPRYYPILCSVEGCYPKGTIRFFVTVNATDFIFIYLGRAMIDCGR